MSKDYLCGFLHLFQNINYIFIPCSVGSDNHLQLGDQICLQGKKKSAGKRITGFQVMFCIFLFTSHKDLRYENIS